MMRPTFKMLNESLKELMTLILKNEKRMRLAEIDLHPFCLNSIASQKTSSNSKGSKEREGVI